MDYEIMEIPHTELAMRGSYHLGKGALRGVRGHSSFILIRKNQYLVTLSVLLSSRLDETGGRELKHQYLYWKLIFFGPDGSSGQLATRRAS